MDDDKLVLSRIDDYIDKALQIGRPVYTDFLNPNQQSQVINMLSKNNDITFSAFGGDMVLTNDFLRGMKKTNNLLPDARHSLQVQPAGGHDRCERRVFAINSVDSFVEPDFKIVKVLKIEFDKFNEKWNEHRSILGSVVGLGYDRRMIGDILIDGQTAYVFMLKAAADYAVDNLVSVGQANVSCSVHDVSQLDIAERHGQIKQKTVSSLRIDAVLAASLNLSRGKAVELIGSDVVFVNFRLISKATFILSEGDVISIRKKGRVILKSIGSKSAKDRTWIELECLF